VSRVSDGARGDLEVRRPVSEPSSEGEVTGHLQRVPRREQRASLKTFMNDSFEEDMEQRTMSSLSRTTPSTERKFVDSSEFASTSKIDGQFDGSSCSIGTNASEIFGSKKGTEDRAERR